ncbi:hypothetical protein BGZ46_000997 [Entomortierella lignicola]|nr:hypothetical protein BGZ46_000997 [Entomortierella lignicola]
MKAYKEDEETVELASIETHQGELLPSSVPSTGNLTQLQLSNVESKAIEIEKKELELKLEAHKKDKETLELASSGMLIFVLCFQLLLDCHRPDVYKEEEIEKLEQSPGLMPNLLFLLVMFRLILSTTRALYSNILVIGKIKHQSRALN